MKQALNLFYLFNKLQKRRGEFQIYKLKYHQGGEIQETIKRIAADLKQYEEGSPSLLRAIGSMQWVQSTNSLVYTGPLDGIEELTGLNRKLRCPPKTNLHRSLSDRNRCEESARLWLRMGWGWKISR